MNYYQSAANGLEIDWGDGSAVTKNSSTSYTSSSHTYNSLGKYIITIKRLTGQYMLGNNSSDVLFNSSNYQKILYKVEIGNTNRTSSPDFACAYCFRYSFNLETITVPNKYKYFPSSLFSICPKLKCVVMSKGAESSTSNSSAVF